MAFAILFISVLALAKGSDDISNSEDSQAFENKGSSERDPIYSTL